jgi:hypothetical protein
VDQRPLARELRVDPALLLPRDLLDRVQGPIDRCVQQQRAIAIHRHPDTFAPRAAPKLEPQVVDDHEIAHTTSRA